MHRPAFAMHSCTRTSTAHSYSGSVCTVYASLTRAYTRLHPYTYVHTSTLTPFVYSIHPNARVEEISRTNKEPCLKTLIKCFKRLCQLPASFSINLLSLNSQTCAVSKLQVKRMYTNHTLLRIQKAQHICALCITRWILFGVSNLSKGP